jgi:hypothetical protein
MVKYLSLEQWSWIGTIASAVFSFLALGAVIFAWRQIRTSTINSAKADANAIQRSLMEKSLEFPQFVAPNPKSVNVKNEEFDGSEVEFRRYEIFVELVLTTLDHLVASYPSDEPTRNYMIQMLSEHRKYLDSAYFREEFWNQLSPEIVHLVEAGIEYDKKRVIRYQSTDVAA